MCLQKAILFKRISDTISKDNRAIRESIVLEIFEQLLSETPKKISYSPRKLVLPHVEDLLLFGPPKCGKTALSLLHASQKKEPYLYINLLDFRIESFLLGDIYRFAKTKKLSTIIIDGFRDQKPPDKMEGIQTILISNCEMDIEGFDKFALFGVDFEEYLSLYKSRSQGKNEEEAVAHIFADFLKDGSLPKISELGEFDKRRYKIERIRDAAKGKTEEAIIVEFLRRSSMKFSLLQVFDALKSKTKISKDFFYSYAQKLESMGVLFFVEKLHQKNSPKKIYSYDFSLKTATDFKKDFPGIFENMVFLELKSRGYEIYYTDEAGLFVPELERTILSKPFLPSDEEKLLLKLSKKASELGIKDVEIITINKEEEREMDKIRIHLMPFWQWALSF